MGLTFGTPNGGNSKKTGHRNSKNNSKATKKTSSYKAPSGHPSAGGYAPKANNRPASPTVSTAKTTPLASNNVQKVEVRPSGSLKNGLTPKVAPKVVASAAPKVAASPSVMAIAESNRDIEKKDTKPSLLAIDAPKEAAPKAPQESKSEVGFFEGIKNAATLLFNDPRTEESGRYNQKYWAERLEQGKAAGNTNIQAELKAEQSKLGGSSKSYNQEKVPGYFEPLNHPSQKMNAKLPVEQSSEQQITDIDNQIKAETNPAKLKALHQRRLSLLRMSRTNTKFAGLLGDADTKRTNLMSIS
jgi:hypothetical protein